MLGGIEIRPGDQLSRDFDIFLDHLELRMIDATTGAPLARRRFESSTGPVISDEDGVLRWTPAPRGVFLTIPRDGKRVQLGPFGMKKGERVTRIDVKM